MSAGSQLKEPRPRTTRGRVVSLRCMKIQGNPPWPVGNGGEHASFHTKKQGGGMGRPPSFLHFEYSLKREVNTVWDK